MSTTLYWRVPEPVTRHSLPYTLKKLLSPRFFDHDGSLGSDEYILAGGEEVAFLEGIAAASNEPAVVAAIEALLDAIKRHGRVAIWTEG